MVKANAGRPFLDSIVSGIINTAPAKKLNAP